jgi:hypothetical protein
MSARPIPFGASAPEVSYAERGTGRHDSTQVASGESGGRETRHQAAVANTLQWADEAAERGDHGNAVAWLDTLEAIGDELPEVYAIRRASWSSHPAA